MSQFVDLRPGQRVHVLRNGDHAQHTHVSTIRQVTDDAVRLDTPRRNGKALAAGEDEALKLFIELHGRMYTFNSRVRALPDGGANELVIDLPRAVQRTERREFFRLNTMISPRYAALTTGDGDELERIEATILDISGGGVRLRTHVALDGGALLRLIFPLGDDSDVDLTIEVLHSGADGRRGSYRVHGRYVDCPRATEEQIVRHIFSEQVQMLQKGAL